MHRSISQQLTVFLGFLAERIPIVATKSACSGFQRVCIVADSFRNIRKTADLMQLVIGKIDRSLFLCMFALITLASLTGCVQRRLIIRSYPEGAFVSVDRQPVGYTPVSVPYTYAGTRQIQLEKDGFKSIDVKERIRPATFDIFPFSLITNNFWPREIRDERLFEFQLEPHDQVSENLLMDRANDLRGNVYRGTVTAPIR